MVPRDLKTAIVTPLLKQQNLDPDVLKNFRPVLQLPFVSRILEKIVLKECQSHLMQNNMYDIRQSAYKENQSTETTVLSVV